MEDVVRPLALQDLTLSKLKTQLSKRFKEIRDRAAGNKFILLLHANEFTKAIEVIASCGLQRDIWKNISEGLLSFNTKWTKDFDLSGNISESSFESGSNAVARQLDVVFKNHSIGHYFCKIIKCNTDEYLIFLEASEQSNELKYFAGLTADEISYVAEKSYLAYLKGYKDSHISDWEKAVHELASPLGFIYSNSDYLIYYLNRADITDAKRQKKLEDLRDISQLLINRLHQYRYAFAGTKNLKLNIKHFSLMEAFMPITHLFFHDAGTKGLKFKYDELRDITIKSDIESVQFIGFNLLSNAIKYSDNGTEIELYAAQEKGGNVTFGVRNVGISISEDEALKIFDLGVRTESAKQKDARGLGVGLDVCKKLTQELRGSIRLVDGSGNKTIFEVNIPNL